MFEFFNTIIEWLSILSGYIVSAFRSLLTMIVLGFKAMASVAFILNLFPPVIIGPIFVLVSLTIVVTIINKWG